MSTSIPTVHKRYLQTKSSMLDCHPSCIMRESLVVCVMFNMFNVFDVFNVFTRSKYHESAVRCGGGTLPLSPTFAVPHEETLKLVRRFVTFIKIICSFQTCSIKYVPKLVSIGNMFIHMFFSCQHHPSPQVLGHNIQHHHVRCVCRSHDA